MSRHKIFIAKPNKGGEKIVKAIKHRGYNLKNTLEDIKSSEIYGWED